MTGVALLAVPAAAASALVTRGLIRLARRLELYDRPTSGRIHTQATPTLGGLGVVPVFLGCLWILPTDAAGGLGSPQLVGLTLGTLVVTALGVYDDLRECGAWVKLVVQAAAALILYAHGFRVDRLTNPLDDAVSLGVLAVPATLGWILVVTNAVNLLDGVDGLAGGVVAIGAFALAMISLRSGEGATYALSLLLAAVLAGFLPFNWPPARIFLGDTGSLALGFVMGAISLLHRRKGTVAITMLLPIVLLGLPLLDALLSFGRRLARGQHPFRRDTEHLHHRLLRLGLSTREVTVVLYGVSACLGLAAYVISLLPAQQVLPVLGLLAIGIAFGIRALRFAERGACRSSGLG